LNRDLNRQRSLVPTTAEVTFYWFHRVIAAYCLMFGLLYWIRLIGIYDGPTWRFDLMPVHWQVASVTLAVLFPFAASGLWMLASWGPVIWFLCAAMEGVMYAGFPELFGDKRLIATIGVQGLVIVDTEAAVLVCPKEREQAVREMVDKLKQDGSALSHGYSLRQPLESLWNM
jgi:hypothetical protein